MKGILVASCILLGVLGNGSEAQNPGIGYQADSTRIEPPKSNTAKAAKPYFPLMTDFRLKKTGLESVINWVTNYPLFPLPYRFNSSEAPGYYFGPPDGKAIAIDSSDVAFIRGLLSKYFSPVYYTASILDSIQSFYLADFDRKEFYFNVEFKNVHFRFSGWYGKFMHIYVFTDFDSREGFIYKASQFFKLSKLSKNNVSFEKSKDPVIHDFIYIYDNTKSDFKLFGYPDLDLRSDNEGEAEFFYNYMLLDLTVYPEENSHE